MKDSNHATPTEIRSLSHHRLAVVALSFAVVLAACERREAAVAPMPAPVPAPATVTVDPNAAAAAQFAAVRTAGGGAVAVFGGYTRGCIAGAEQLALDAPRWQVLHPSRNRAWGHPDLIRFVEGLADGVAADGFRGLLVGDLAQPRGGPLPSDHASHQVGLDADIWLTPMPVQKISAGALETFEPPSMVDFAHLRVNGLFGAAQAAMISRAAQAPEVERIFVSPPIKRALCERATGERSWLRKLRPWYGHSAHMHVRLACPAGSGDCKAQTPPPEGEGCGAELQSWFDDRSWLNKGTKSYEPENAMKLDALPAECLRVLSERG
jgi:penicillin-insensitive murein DD-endopeptidase